MDPKIAKKLEKILKSCLYAGIYAQLNAMEEAMFTQTTLIGNHSVYDHYANFTAPVPIKLKPALTMSIEIPQYLAFCVIRTAEEINNIDITSTATNLEEVGAQNVESLIVATHQERDRLQSFAPDDSFIRCQLMTLISKHAKSGEFVDFALASVMRLLRQLAYIIGNMTFYEARPLNTKLFLGAMTSLVPCLSVIDELSGCLREKVKK